jgi:acyl-CoA synthetase (AMP-forming)/AMP-acid ligase II
MQPIDAFLRSARAHPNRIAAEDWSHDPPRRLTYAELEAEALALAAALQAEHPQPLSRVGICAYNHLDHLIAWLAVLAADKVWVPLYPRNTAEELTRLAAFTEATLVLADAEGAALLTESGLRVLDPEAQAALRRRFAGHRPTRHWPDPAQPQAIKFTGGTTGAPKGVVQPIRAWIACLMSQLHAYGPDADTRYLAAAPITHGTSTYLLPTFAAGGTVVLTDRPKPAETLRLLREAAITTTFVPPTVIYMLMAELDGAPAATPALRHLVYGAGPMRPAEIARALEIFGPVLHSSFGQTEAPQIVAHIGPDDLARPERQASVGQASPMTTVAVMDAAGRILPAGEAGEVVVRGDLVMSGYWNQPDKTRETLIDGWLHTGDLGVLDADGFLFLKGRLKELIITGGFNVYPGDVEPVLGEHPAVADVAIFGVPDAKWGEAVHAAVQVRPGHAADEAALIAFAKERLGSVKAPKRIVFLDALPRNAYGKLQRQQLADRVATGTSSPHCP